MLGFEAENIFAITEGWPLGISCFKVLFENGVDLADVPSQGNELLDSYLFYECTNRLPRKMVDFLKASATFEELDPKMLDAVTDKKTHFFFLIVW